MGDTAETVSNLIFKLEPEKKSYELFIQITKSSLEYLITQMAKIDNTDKKSSFDILQIAIEKKAYELQIQIKKSELAHLEEQSKRLDQEIADKKMILGILQQDKPTLSSSITKRT